MEEFEASKATSGDSSFCGVAKSVNSGQDLGSAQVGITNSSSVFCAWEVNLGLESKTEIY